MSSSSSAYFFAAVFFARAFRGAEAFGLFTVRFVFFAVDFFFATIGHLRERKQ